MTTNLVADAHPLSLMPYAQATVIINNHGDIALVSYVTHVATLTADGWLTIRGLYSATTHKHIRAFVREFVPFEMDFQSIKALATESYALNIYTGEIVDIY